MSENSDNLKITKNYKITNIHRGSKDKGRDKILYANLVDENDNLVLSATLNYITQRIMADTIT